MSKQDDEQSGIPSFRFPSYHGVQYSVPHAPRPFDTTYVSSDTWPLQGGTWFRSAQGLGYHLCSQKITYHGLLSTTEILQTPG